jgi:hypothetical protein
VTGTRLEDVLTQAEGEARVLKRHGQKAHAESLERLCADVRSAAADYLAFISEPDARLRSGHSVEWLRSQFARWESEGNAEKRHGKRYYRACVVPQREHLSAARLAGRIGA